MHFGGASLGKEENIRNILINIKLVLVHFEIYLTMIVAKLLGQHCNF